MSESHAEGAMPSVGDFFTAAPSPPSEPEPPHRTRLSVPAADVSTIRWLGAQDNVSASIRALIRQHIAIEGYTDPTCSPVEQQPRRGRPKGSRDRTRRRARLQQRRAESDAAKAEASDASIAAHQATEQVISRGLAEGWLVVDHYGEAVCIDCGREFAHHAEGCWHADRCRVCFAEPGSHLADCTAQLRDLDFDDEADDPAPLPPLHNQILAASGRLGADSTITPAPENH